MSNTSQLGGLVAPTVPRSKKRRARQSLATAVAEAESSTFTAADSNILARCEQDLTVAHAFAKKFKTEAPWYGAWNIIPILKFTFGALFTLPTTMSALVIPQLPITVTDKEAIDEEDIKALYDDIIRDISPSFSAADIYTPASEETANPQVEDSLTRFIYSLSPLTSVPANAVSPQFLPEGSAATEIRSLTDRLAAMQSPGRDAGPGTEAAFDRLNRPTGQLEHGSPSGKVFPLLSPIQLETVLPKQVDDTPPSIPTRSQESTPEPRRSYPADILELTPYRANLLRHMIGEQIQEKLKVKSRRIPDFVLKIVEVKQKDGHPVQHVQIRCHRTVLIIEIKTEKSRHAAELALKRVWDSQVKEQAMYAFKDCPALTRVAAILAFGPLWFYGEFDRVAIDSEKRSGDDDPYVPSDSGVDSDSEAEDDGEDSDTQAEDDDEDSDKFEPRADTTPGGTSESRANTATEGASEGPVGPDSAYYDKLFNTFYKDGDPMQPILLHILSLEGMTALQLVGARLMELGRELWPELAAEAGSRESQLDH